MQKFVAAIDQGTTSTRFIIFDNDGRVIAADSMEHKQIFPKSGWVEHDALEIWQNTKAVMTGVLQKASSVQSDEIAAIGVTNQRETTVVWDKNTGIPIYNAIVWQDTRTDVMIKKLAKQGGQDRFHKTTGLEATAYQTREILDAMEKDSGVKLSALKVDGGMVGNELLMQFQSDILNVPVVRSKITETTALGSRLSGWLLENHR